MANSLRLQHLHCLPGVPSRSALGSVDGAVDAIFKSLAEGIHLRRFIRVVFVGARLISGEVDAHDAAVLVLAAEVDHRGRVLAHVAHAAKDAADINAELLLPALEPAQYRLHHVCRRYFCLGVDEQLGRIASFHVDDTFRSFVLDKLVGDLLDAWWRELDAWE